MKRQQHRNILLAVESIERSTLYTDGWHSSSYQRGIPAYSNIDTQESQQERKRVDFCTVNNAIVKQWVTFIFDIVRVNIIISIRNSSDT